MNSQPKESLYNLINPSDPVTFKAPSLEAAVGAVMYVSGGQYGADAYGDDDQHLEAYSVPIFMTHRKDMKKWLDGRGESFDSFLERYKDDIVATLNSFVTCSLRERRMYDMAIKAITQEDKRKVFESEWDDKARSSLNQISNYARSAAAQLQGQAPAADAPAEPASLMGAAPAM